jgi:hypothetical protein
MTHFLGVVLDDKTNSHDEELLEPFSENLEIPAYIGEKLDDWLADERRELSEDSPDRNLTDDQFKRKIISQGYYHYDDHGNRLTTYNPDSQWDWYSVGGRWAEDLEDLYGTSTSIPVNKFLQILTEELDEDQIPRALVYDDPEKGPTWLEDGPTGWFGMHDQVIDPEEWRQIIVDKLTAYKHDPNVFVWFYDFHI